MDPSECDHPVQFNGMCGVCGADVTDGKYHSEGLEAALQTESFQVSHDSSAIRVSANEARRLDDESRHHLLDTRRLVLIVDLDQTIIHTTVDPTVGEWMDEIAASKEDEASNPNAEALKDVARFKVPDDAPPGWKGAGPDRWYYTKPRPGLTQFLSRISKLYELHVYTMGTRSYANAVCQAVDPTGEYFGDRILSRDESSSLKSKDLRRLFPTDQSMVVIIDDRSDVWNDSPNLVKVVPYNFFLGVGDINGTFLPPQPSTPSSAPPDSSASANDSAPDITPEQGLEAHARLMDKVSQERPLAKIQEKLEANGNESEEKENPADPDAEKPPDAGVTKTEQTNSPSTRPLLSLEDFELDRVAGLLTRIHAAWYKSYGLRHNTSADAILPSECHVELIISQIKRSVFDRQTFVFSGIFPSHIPPESTHIWKASQSFGARCTRDIDDRHCPPTHCITANPQTEKSLRAKAKGLHVLWQEWLWRCVELWQRVPEEGYRAEIAQPAVSADSGMSRSASKEGQSRGKRSTTPTEPPNTSVPSQLDPAHRAAAADERKGEAARPEEDGLDSGEDGRPVEDGLDLGEEEFADVGNGWDDAAQAELDEFLLGSDDEEYTDDGEGSRNGSQAPESRAESRASTPPTPGGRKRVRYADEESLPLESFKDPSPPDPHGIEDGADSPRKRHKPLLLLPAEEGEVDEQHRFQWRGKQKRELEERTKNGLLSPEVDRGDTQQGRVNGAEEDEEDDDLAALLALEVADQHD